MPNPPLTIKKFGSLDTRREPGRVAGAQLTQARNIRYIGDDVDIRPGLTFVTRGPDSNAALTGMGSFRDAGGKDLLVFLDDQANLWATNPYPGQPVGSSITLASGLSSANVLVQGSILKLESASFPIAAGSYIDTAAAYNRLFFVTSENQPGTGGAFRQMYWNTDLGKYRYYSAATPVRSAASGESYSSAGVSGDVTSGTRYAIVLYESEKGGISGFRSAIIVRVDLASADDQIAVINLPTDVDLGDSAMTRRIVAFTVQGASSEGPYYYIPEDDYIEGLNAAVDANGNNITSTVITDNSQTTAQFNFTDEYLVSSIDVSQYLDMAATETDINGKSIFFSKTLKRLIVCGEDDTTFRISDVDSPGQFRLSTGLARPGEGDGGVSMCAREFRSEVYLLKDNGGYVVADSSLTPAEWNIPNRWSGSGPCGPWAVDVSNEFMAYAHRSGPWVYLGGDPVWLGEWICGNKKNFYNWDNINWDYSHLIYVTIDAVNKLIRFGVPLGNATQVSHEFILDYSLGFKKHRWSYDDCNAVRSLETKKPEDTSNHLYFASNSPDGSCLMEDLDSETLNGAPITQVFQSGFLPNSPGPIFTYDSTVLMLGGMGNVNVKIHGDGVDDLGDLALNDAPTNFVVKGVGQQSDKFSIELSNKGEAGSHFLIQDLAFYIDPVWEGPIP